MDLKFDLKKVSLIIAFIGLGILYVFFLNAKVPMVDGSLIDDSMIGKTIKSDVRISSVKYYNSSFTIYPKEYKFKMTGFEKLEVELNEGDLVSFSGKVDEDKYGIIIILDEVKIRKVFK